MRGRDPVVFPDEWRPIVLRSVSQWPVLTPEERMRLETSVWMLVHGKRWEAAQGFELTDEIQVTIAAQAALLVLGLDAEEAYDNVGLIIVHPTTVVLHGQRGSYIAGTVTDAPMPILGLAQHDGPIVIAWDEALNNSRHPERGHNVVYHEFAHKIDMLDGISDGTPPLETQAAMDRWIEVCTREYEALRDGLDDGFLNSYGGVNPAEFFAVVTEVFFDIPIEMEAHRPELYGVLRDFYRQDPAARVRSHTTDTP